MLTDLCQELHNWFCKDSEKHTGEFTIEEGGLTASFLKNGQYFRIIGSVFNDGVWRYGERGLTNETFTGEVWAMSVPRAILDLNTEIDEWISRYGTASVGPYASESFGGYSYTKATASGSGADPTTWQGAFHSRLNRWRKM